MDAIVKPFVSAGLLISMAFLALGLTMEGLAGPYSLWGVGTYTAVAGVLGTGLFGGFFVGMLTDGSPSY